jgi:hypothetical protein
MLPNSNFSINIDNFPESKTIIKPMLTDIEDNPEDVPKSKTVINPMLFDIEDNPADIPEPKTIIKPMVTDIEDNPEDVPESKSIINPMLFDIEDNTESITNNKPIDFDDNPETETIKEDGVMIQYKNSFTDDDKNILRLVAVICGILVFLIVVAGCLAYTELDKEEVSLCRKEVHGVGVCDEHQNTPQCEYDGLDCCMSFRELSFCDVCDCHLTI